MQVNKINNIQFKSVNTSKAEGLLFSRLNSPKKYTMFYDYIEQCKEIPYNIELYEGKNNKLKAKVINKDNDLIFDIEEFFVNRKLNTNPLNFLKNLIKLVNASTEGTKYNFKFEPFVPSNK